MIHFECPTCGREFNVPDHFAGKRADCGKCGSMVFVPRPVVHHPPPPPPIAPPAKVTVRTRRLIADVRQMREAFAEGALIRILEIDGDIAEAYKIEFRIRGIEKLKKKQPVVREQHIAEIRMTRDYPRLAPACRMLTPIFHPNIDESAICVGDHWAAGERLVDLTVRIGEMIAYQAYNIKSPLNGEAAMWADLNPNLLPVDGRNLHPPMLERAG
jgi:ubiquitin-protein ligase/ribosomal protein S27AE